jgi:uncharacterized protein YaaN involved in tellurite resistance
MNHHQDNSDPASPAGSDRSDSASFAGADAAPRHPADVERIGRWVAEFVEAAATLEPGGKKYLRSIASIDRLGQREFAAVSAVSGRMLERRLHVDRGMLAARGPLARQLAELRRLVEELSPARLDPARKRSRGPFGLGRRHDEVDELEHYAEQFDRSQGHVEEIVENLNASRLTLERDNALIDQEQVSLATVMETLEENAYVARRLDQALSSRIETISATDPSRADCLRSDVLYAIRRRHQDILTQLAVAAQGLASLRIVEGSNDEVVRAIEAATATTATALRTAALVAQAVASQRMVMEQLKAAEAMAEEAAELAERDSEVPAGPAGAAARVVMLRRAWSDVQAALDRVDAQKEQAIRNLIAEGPGPDSRG